MLILAALVPWVGGRPGSLFSGMGPSPVVLVLAVVAAVGMVLGQFLPRVLPFVLAAVWLVGILTLWSGRRIQVCWDGLDELGNHIGGCEFGVWTWAPGLFLAGLAVLTVACAWRWLGRGAEPDSDR
ncbi:MAG: hypothetical protein ACK5H2_02040 [Beutenbergiaceae bacterium]